MYFIKPHILKLILLLALGIFVQSCQHSENQLTETQKQDITNAASAVVNKVFEYSNNLDFESGLDHYSDATDSYFIIDGEILSLSDLKEAYKAVEPSVEDLHNTIESWNIQVLSPDVVTFTLPVKLMLKLKGVPEYTGQLIWTATLQKQQGEWLIINSHESWLNCDEVALALSQVNFN